MKIQVLHVCWCRHGADCPRSGHMYSPLLRPRRPRLIAERLWPLDRDTWQLRSTVRLVGCRLQLNLATPSIRLVYLPSFCGCFIGFHVGKNIPVPWMVWVIPSWWLEPSHSKNLSQNGKLAQVGMNTKNMWNHHLGKVRIAVDKPCENLPFAIEHLSAAGGCSWLKV